MGARLFLSIIYSFACSNPLLLSMSGISHHCFNLTYPTLSTNQCLVSAAIGLNFSTMQFADLIVAFGVLTEFYFNAHFVNRVLTSHDIVGELLSVT